MHSPAARSSPCTAAHPSGGRRTRANTIDRSYSRLEDLLADTRVEAVYVSTTNDRHASEVLAAARAGRHVLCEKPLAMTLDEATGMVRACRQAGVVLATNHGRRQEPAVRALRRLVQEGRLGRLLAARASTGVLLPERLRGWRLADVQAGAGVVLDVVVHEADTLRFVLQDEVVEVTALTAAQGMTHEVSHGVSEGAVEDSVSGAFRLQGGVLASFSCAFNQPFGESGIAVHGSDASAQVRRLPDRSQVLVFHDASGEAEVPLPVLPAVGELTVRAFEAAARGEGAPTATGQDGVRSLAVALAVLES